MDQGYQGYQGVEMELPKKFSTQLCVRHDGYDKVLFAKLGFFINLSDITSQELRDAGKHLAQSIHKQADGRLLKPEKVTEFTKHELIDEATEAYLLELKRLGTLDLTNWEWFGDWKTRIEGTGRGGK